MKVGLAADLGDLHQRDPDYIRGTLPWVWLAASFYFRGDIRGLDLIPESGPVLLVGNHSGGNFTPDTLLFTLAFTTYFGVERRFHQLAHSLVLRMPAISGMLRKYGTLEASQDNAERALQFGSAVLVYPGGDWEVHRPSWHSGEIEFAGRMGFVELALRNRVPIVPVVSIGGQETALFLTRGEGLAQLLQLDRLFRLKVLPISLSLPWGVNVGDFTSHIPLPAKITVQVMEPIDLREHYGEDPDVDAIYDDVITSMQTILEALGEGRRLPVIG